PTLVSLRLEAKRRRLEEMGYNDEAVSIAVNSPQHKRTLAKYALPQDQYSRWCLQQDIDPLTPNPPQLANWLASGMATRWKASTAQAYKKAVVAMYQDQSAFKDVDFLDFMKRVNEKDINVRCINMSDERLKIQEEFAILPITWPKETREGRPISWCLTIRKHDDPSLCPVATISEYWSRVKASPCLVPHHKNPDITSTPLIRSLKDYGTPVTSQTISNHAKIIMRMLPLAALMTMPSGRATSSTSAFQQGAPSSDIAAYANWSSTILFDKYYRMGSVMKTNFSTTILRSRD
ncbi:hypothetical protein BGZ52_008617, partial [Haplosporangium bisporale]